MAFLSLDQVSKRFDGVTAVDHVSFAVDRGQVVGFLGPNGAGKSTTMRMITQYYEPDAGTISFDGVPLADSGRAAKRRIGYLAENNPLYEDMLVHDYLAFIADLRELAGPPRGQAMDAAVAATGIESVYYRPIAELSKGFRQRVGLAQAILHRPDLLVLDEPTEGLDPNQRVEIRRLIGALGKDRTVILSTHVLSEVQQTCSRLLIISRGKIVADGPVEQLIAPAAVAINWSTGPSATIFPRLMISRREQVCWTSESTCVDRMTVRSLPSAPIKRRISTRWLGSSPSVGSSNTSRSGRCRIACARPTRWRNPFDSSEIGRK